MDRNKEAGRDFALIKQSYDQIVSIRDPHTVSTWQPSGSERATYVRLLCDTIDRISSIERSQNRRVLSTGSTSHYVPATLLKYYRDRVEPSVSTLWKALVELDPEIAQLEEILSGPPSPERRLKRTFEEGLNRMQELVDNNPECEETFAPSRAFDLLDSKLVSFDPDSWLEHANALEPILTGRKNVELPIQIRSRLEEIYRAYIFGCSLAVLSLSRSALEYAILDNLKKFEIDPQWPCETKGKREKKKLRDLIDEIGAHLPEQIESMHRLRDYGNDYLHPVKSDASRNLLFGRAEASEDAIRRLARCVEALYLAETVTT